MKNIGDISKRNGKCQCVSLNVGYFWTKTRKKRI